mgnify:CR=1 FL=1
MRIFRSMNECLYGKIDRKLIWDFWNLWFWGLWIEYFDRAIHPCMPEQQSHVSEDISTLCSRNKRKDL